jgi:S1-C subfamily serine protease
LQLPVKHGALVDTVTADGPAAAAGLRGGTREEQFQGQTVTAGGDVIVSVDGRTVAGAADLVRIVTNLRPGQTAVFTVVRASGRRAIAVTLAARSPR